MESKKIVISFTDFRTFAGKVVLVIKKCEGKELSNDYAFGRMKQNFFDSSL